MKKLLLYIFLFQLTTVFAQSELYRPDFHFSPQQNWLNDPNGLVYFDGEYHLFYQYNPYGDQWGNMSWGHAVSTDFVHWQELPVAIPVINGIAAFSGSAVVDWNNTSGFGINGEPPMVAIYTGAGNGGQRQHIAYSNDKGRTWTTYSGNPVLDLYNNEFRDPKVFWYEPTQKWIMVVSLGADKRVRFYQSANLKSWTFLHDFGDVGLLSGVWECPDLFELPVDGDTSNTKWVLQVDVAPGTPQYFIGDFDGTAFIADKFPTENANTLPQGVILQGFENGYGNWTTTGTAFGTAPANGALPNQLPVSGYLGDAFANSYHNGDASIGTLTSPTFTISNNYINFKIGGGNHINETYIRLLINGNEVHKTTGNDDENLVWKSWNVNNYIGQNAVIEIVDNRTGSWGHLNIDHIFQSNTSMLQSNTGANINGYVFQDFENGYGNWTATGTAFGTAPANGALPNQLPVSGYLGDAFANSYHNGDASIGTLTSPTFTISNNYINFKIGGGNHINETYIRLLINGNEVHKTTGNDDENLVWKSWNVNNYIGQNAVIEIVDNRTGSWGHLNIDHIFQSNTSMLQSNTGANINGYVFQDFENGYGNWTATGNCFGTAPANGTLAGQQDVLGYLGNSLVNTFLNGDATTGTLTSPTFTIDSQYVSFKIGGGNHSQGTFIGLYINGSYVMTSTGENTEFLDWENWDVSAYIGQTAQLRIVDNETGGWGHINIDHILFTNEMITEPTAYDLVDYGKDFYAVQSYSDIPQNDGRRIWLAWLNNWDYAGAVPTSPWRGVMTIPRTVGLTEENGQVILTQQPVAELQNLRINPTNFQNTSIAAIKPTFDNLQLKTYEIKTTIDVGTATEIGFRFKKGSNQETTVIYDVTEEELTFDRSNSGSPMVSDNSFIEPQTAPLKTENGQIELHFLVDNSSIEIFGNGGKVVLTNQIFPDSTSNGVEIYDAGGSATIINMDIWELEKSLISTQVIPIKSTVKVYPNPIGNNNLKVELPKTWKDVSLMVYDGQSKLIYQASTNNEFGIIELPNYAFPTKGLYFLHLSNGDEVVIEKILR